MENRSTVAPASAILIAAASPAKSSADHNDSGACRHGLINFLSLFASVQARARSQHHRRRNVDRCIGKFGADEGPDAIETDGAKNDAAGEANPGEAPPRLFAWRDTPLGREEPDSVGKVPADGDHGDDVEGQDPGIRKFCLHLVKRHARIVGQVRAHETLGGHVVADVNECEDAGPALRGVHPVAGPGVIHDVRSAAEPNEDAVDGVVSDGNENENPFQHAHRRQAIEELHLRRVGRGAFQRLEVGDEMLQQKCADGNDAEQGMQLVPEERVAFAGAKRLYAARTCGAAGFWAVAMKMRSPEPAAAGNMAPRVSD